MGPRPTLYQERFIKIQQLLYLFGPGWKRFWWGGGNHIIAVSICAVVIFSVSKIGAAPTVAPTPLLSTFVIRASLKKLFRVKKIKETKPDNASGFAPNAEDETSGPYHREEVTKQSRVIQRLAFVASPHTTRR